jgi:hypothetical protein
LDIGVTPTAKVAPLWQFAQPPAMPAWFMIPGTKLLWLWQSEQDIVVGR